MHDARAVDDRRQHDLERPPSLEMADDRRLREIVQARAEQEIKPGSADQRDNAHQQRQAESMPDGEARSEEHTSELQSLMRISYAVFCLKKKTHETSNTQILKQLLSNTHTAPYHTTKYNIIRTL